MVGDDGMHVKTYLPVILGCRAGNGGSASRTFYRYSISSLAGKRTLARDAYLSPVPR